ncbi:hypothetical protein Gohar_001546 [Gossypium harknessii]|uniref:Uncharacterized protein n=1 Tax=Gossypium harknessii TaxID=34285 RepID=A0A7J9I499_9ROSI|nr:hypothetical protein [Gossypium harknessii]
MAHLFRDLSLGHSKRESTPRPSPLQTKPQPMPSKLTSADLQSPFGQLASQLNDSDLRFIAYDVFLAVCRTSSSKPLSTSASFNSDSPSHNSPGQNHNHSPNTPALQRSLTSAAASKMKKALGLKSPGSSPGSKKSPGSGPGSGQGKSKRPVTVGELMRIQMRVPEAVDARVRRSLLRIGGGLVGRRIESVVLPFELLQQRNQILLINKNMVSGRKETSSFLKLVYFCILVCHLISQIMHHKGYSRSFMQP